MDTVHATPAVIEQQVLEITSHLVAELAGASPRPPRLEDSLERDLGISSLERVELLLRLERELDIRFPDSVLAEAVTPQDLVNAVRLASPAAIETIHATCQPPIAGAMIPTSARTLVDALRWHAERTPDRIHIHLRLEDGSEKPITYGELLVGARAAAAGLQVLGVVEGESVALMLRTEQAYFEAFFGTLLAGAVPVPLYPPVRHNEIVDYVRRQAKILRNAAVRVLVAFSEAERLAALIRAQAPSIERITTVQQLATAGSKIAADTRALSSDDPALIQYTSGSTGDPKGVVLSHANLLANIRAIGEAIAVQPTDVTVSWLPLYHDMGLIGSWLGSLYFGVPIAIMSPLAFLGRPERWLWAIHAHHGTVSPAPNFAFDLCVRKVADADIKGLDLRHWRLAFNGSEVVSPDTIERFTRRFAPYGFRAESMCPVYGLAESSVGLTISAIGRPPRVDRIARQPFEAAREVRCAAADETHPLRFVSCGRPLPGHDVRIADGVGQPLGERVEGHVQFRGPSVTRGYHHDLGATDAVLHDGWMDSGDLGYWVDGDLFITGREKDLIILGGRNVYAQEIEDIAAEVDGIRKGCVAAFGVADPAIGTERLVVVAETRDHTVERRDRLRLAIIDRVASGIGVPPDVVVIADPGAVLKTPSGKIRRGASRDAYLRGTLGRRTPMAWQWASLQVRRAGAQARRWTSWIGRALFTVWVIVVLLLTLPALWIGLLVTRSRRRAEQITKRWSRLALALCGIRVRITGLDNLTGVGAGILISNHASYIDPVVLLATIPQPFRFIAKRRLADYPLIGTVIRKAGHATVEKADVSHRLAGAEDVAALVANSGLLLLFPEGTFFRPPGLLPFRLGAFKAAVETSRPIVPIAIRGTRRILPDGTWLLRHGPIDVIVGTPLLPHARSWEEMIRLRDTAREEIARGCGE